MILILFFFQIFFSLTIYSSCFFGREVKLFYNTVKPLLWYLFGIWFFRTYIECVFLTVSTALFVSFHILTLILPFISSHSQCFYPHSQNHITISCLISQSLFPSIFSSSFSPFLFYSLPSCCSHSHSLSNPVLFSQC